MKNCRECGAEMNDTALFCSVCGTKQHICNEGAESDEDKYAALEEELFGMENENNTVNRNLEEKERTAVIEKKVGWNFKYPFVRMYLMPFEEKGVSPAKIIQNVKD